MLVLLLASCPFDPAAPARCVDGDNCPSGFACVDGFCVRPDAPSTTDGATIDGAVVQLDGSLADRAAQDRDATTADGAAPGEAGPGADAAAGDQGPPGDAVGLDGAGAEAGSSEAGATDLAAADRASVDGAAVDSLSTDTASPDTASVDVAPVDSGPACEPSSCPVSTEACLLPTCGASGCTFTVAEENAACPDGICRSGQCEALCWIDSTTVQPGALLTPGGCLACRPEVNAFEYRALDNNDPCDDGLWCTGTDRCSGEFCAISEYSGDGRCDGNTPRCDEAGNRCVQCTSSAHCAGTPAIPHCKLDTGTCVACLSPADCPDDNEVCTTTSCVNNVCGVVNNSLGCTDGLWCTGTDTCSGGDCTEHQYIGNLRCASGTPLCDEDNDRCVQCLSVANCSDDVNVCTTKVCTDGSCGQINNTASCDDGLWCNGTDTCSLGGCTHQYTNRCSGVTYRTVCDDDQDRCECSAVTCPAGYTCEATSGACRRTVIFTLADINADGLQDPYGNNVDFWWITLDSAQHWGALRYQLLNVPRSATIVNATLSVYVDAADESTANDTIYVQDVASAPALVEGTNYISGRARAATTVIWNQALGTAGRHSSPELKTLIQHVVSRADWNAGQYLLLIFNHRITGTRFEFRQYDNLESGALLGAYGATLTVTYELP